jgi:hypothetical protein
VALDIPSRPRLLDLDDALALKELRAAGLDVESIVRRADTMSYMVVAECTRCHESLVGDVRGRVSSSGMIENILTWFGETHPWSQCPVTVERLARERTEFLADALWSAHWR